jgi:signal-transduction protein with cAMP-binding, CBS, and nucleotidyltransferase domain
MPTVKDIMKLIVNINPTCTVLQAANLMKETDRGSLLVLDGKITAGIITERDLVLRVIAKNLPHTTPVSRVMSSPLVTINADTTPREAARIMSERKIRRLPVVEAGAVAGVVLASDVLHYLSRKTLTEQIWEALIVGHQK